MRSTSLVRTRRLRWMLAAAAAALLLCVDSALAESPPRPYSIHDTDGDGYLSLQEYQVLLEIRRQRQQRHRRGGFLPPPPFEQVDRDGDGRIGEQELTEALRYRMFHHHRPGTHWR